MNLLAKIIRKIKYLIKTPIERARVLAERKKLIANYKKAEKLIIMLVPDGDIINGGVLSLVSIYKEFTRLKNIHGCEVLAATNNYNCETYFLNFTNFKNQMQIFDLKTIFDEVPNIKELHFHLPELFIDGFLNDFENKWSLNHKQIFLNTDKTSMNILNQNIVLMPEVSSIQKLKNIFGDEITMTMAHKQYANQDMKDKYEIPVHYLSSWFNPVPYDVKEFKNKKNLILFSPDELSRTNIQTKNSKQDLIHSIQKKFPDFEIKIIKKLKYDDYKALVSDAKFMITLGEGLDGYYVENVMCGGISFAVYNTDFFTPEYDNLQTVYKSIDQLFERINIDIQDFNTNPDAFKAYNTVQKEIIEREYSYEKYQKRVEDFILGNYDFK